jgi:hypothetical protein
LSAGETGLCDLDGEEDLAPENREAIIQGFFND